MKTRIVSKICGLMMFLPLVANAQQTVKGIVKGPDGLPLPGVKVDVDETFFRSYSDETGSFLFAKVKSGTYNFNFSLTGFVSKTEIVEVSNSEVILNISLEQNTQLIEEMLVKYVVADDKTPTTYTNLNTKQIESANYGQDLPYLLRMTPSTVVTSDAGAGVGYTGIRIRGVDPTRTNVTVNGIPLNDSESHGVFWVNMPDFASSVDNIQVQRGVGTSSNGATAFGASINIKTDKVNRDAFATMDNAYGSFNTWRNTVSVGTGVMDNKFSFDTRLSRITSDGYIDRASSNLKSFYLSGAYLGNKTQVRMNMFTGREKTYQAWYGTPESVLFGTEQDRIDYADRNYIYGADRDNILNSDRTYNFYTYENEVDNYGQDHYQLHLSHAFNYKWKINGALHYTRGKGYYEQYRVGDSLSLYGINDLYIGGDTIEVSDFIRRLWLDNHFYGGIFALNYGLGAIEMTLGGGANQYLGKHYGEVVWAQFASNSQIRDRYYENDATKNEVHAYLKGTYRRGILTYYGDIQVRHIDYSYYGIDDVNGVLVEDEQNAIYNFINPKAGLMADFNSRNNAYISVARANREPVRQDFVESTPANRPMHEQLTDVEAGYRYKGSRLFVNANAFYMNYKNQLILTGAINDVGGYTRTNVDKSYRAGVEVEAGYRILNNLNVTGNITYSQNKIQNFIEYVDEFDASFNYLGQREINHSKTDLAFSPNIIAAGGVSYMPIKGLEFTLLGKYVGKQYLDNTSNENRKMEGYFTANFEINYTVTPKFMEEITLGVLINNLFNELYVNNGYTWGYIYGGERTVENFYYPQAGRNFLVRATLKL